MSDRLNWSVYGKRENGKCIFNKLSGQTSDEL